MNIHFTEEIRYITVDTTGLPSYTYSCQILKNNNNNGATSTESNINIKLIAKHNIK